MPFLLWTWVAGWRTRGREVASSVRTNKEMRMQGSPPSGLMPSTSRFRVKIDDVSRLREIQNIFYDVTCRNRWQSHLLSNLRKPIEPARFRSPSLSIRRQCATPAFS